MTKRIKQLGGNYPANAFNALASQVEGKGVVLVVNINTHCEECAKLQDFINLLKNGWITKLANLVVCYGYSNLRSGESPPAEDEKKDKKAEKRPKNPANDLSPDEKLKNQKRLGDSALMHWTPLPEGHGYALFTGPNDVQVYNGEFDHSEFRANVLTTLRRCKSPVKTLAGLKGKSQFMEKKKTGIIVEYNGSTANSVVTDTEAEVLKHEKKLTIPVYFCKGLGQEIALYRDGSLVFKNKGLAFDKFLKKMPKMPVPEPKG
ncbi:MAG: hypothetical protein RRB13_08480 [bacterium]|nr:hypothetical protein [bacterium]